MMVNTKKYWCDSIAHITQYFTVFINIINIFQYFTLFYKNTFRNISCKYFDGISHISHDMLCFVIYVIMFHNILPDVYHRILPKYYVFCFVIYFQIF